MMRKIQLYSRIECLCIYIFYAIKSEKFVVEDVPLIRIGLIEKVTNRHIEYRVLNGKFREFGITANWLITQL